MCVVVYRSEVYGSLHSCIVVRILEGGRKDVSSTPRGGMVDSRWLVSAAL